MNTQRRFAAAFALVSILLFAAPPAEAGFVTGVGAQRTAHLFDGANGVNVTVLVNETLQGAVENKFIFTLNGTNATAAATYRVAIILSPGHPETETGWSAPVSVPAGTSSTNVAVTVPAETIQGRLRNAPFRAQLEDGAGARVDFVDFSADLLYRDPPPDGGMLQLAAATVFFWGLVLLYAGYLHLSLRKLRQKAELLERSSEGSTPGGSNDRDGR